MKLVKGLPPLTCREISSVLYARDFLIFTDACPTIAQRKKNHIFNNYYE